MTDLPELVPPQSLRPEPHDHDTADPAAAEVESAPASSQPAGPLASLVAAHFQRVEVAMLGRVLTTTLAGALPPTMVRVERRRTPTQRLARRPGEPVGVSITAGERTLTFRSLDVGRTEATVSHTVRGVVLSTATVTVGEWLDQLAELLQDATNNDQETRAALERALLT